MINLDSITNENNKEHKEKWPYIRDHPQRIIIIGGSGSGKTNALLNLINEQNDIDKIYLHARDLSEPKYEYLIKKRESAGIKHLNNPNAFIECSNTMDDVYEDINDYNRIEKIKKIIVFDDMITDIMTSKKILSHNQRIIYQVQKTKCFTCFYHSMLFFWPKRFQIKYITLFHHENKQQNRIKKY